MTQDIVNNISSADGSQDISVNQLALLMEFATAITPRQATTATYVTVAETIQTLINQGIIQFQNLQYLTTSQISVLAAMTPAQIQLLSQFTPYQIQTLSSLSLHQLRTLTELTPPQLRTLAELTLPQIQTLGQLPATPSHGYGISAPAASPISRATT